MNNDCSSIYKFLGDLDINGVVLVIDAISACGAALPRMGLGKVEAVSYTHLDVYKRQGVGSGVDNVLPWRNFVRNLNFLLNDLWSLLDWAFQVDLGDFLTQVKRLVDQLDEAVSNVDFNVGTFFDVFADKTSGGEG